MNDSPGKECESVIVFESLDLCTQHFFVCLAKTVIKLCGYLYPNKVTLMVLDHDAAICNRM